MDYGSGNVKSISNLVSYLGYRVIVSNEISVINSATHLILPGVGSFGTAMKNINSQIPISEIEVEVIQKKKPFLGICVGMQVLAEKGYEHGEHDGLGWIAGTVEKLNAGNAPLPHIGWNNIVLKRDSVLFHNLDVINDFYFVHSYSVKTNESYITSETNYEGVFCSSIQKENIYGVQFHPEKSQKAGQKLIQNFLKIS
jgi:imidazole glycerol-phosphate synthase subunit HisH